MLITIKTFQECMIMYSSKQLDEVDIDIMESMNINDIPSELLLHIFSFLPKRDLFMTVEQVCSYWQELSMSSSLWRNVEYLSIYGEFSNAFEHLYKIQNCVKRLVITPGHVINFFGFQRKLQFLNLQTLDVSDKLVVSEVFFDKIIQRCPNLENIKFISDSRFNMEHCLSKLCELKLISIDIGYFYGTKTLDDHLISLLRKQPRMRKIALRGWNKIKDDTIAAVLDEFPNITSFYLSNGDTSNEAFTKSIVPLNLTELTVHSNLIDDHGLGIIIKRCHSLRVLNIEQNREITDLGLCKVANHCPFLEELSIGNTFPQHSDKLTNRGLFCIAEQCKKLKYFSTIGCKIIDDDGIVSIVKSCRHLTGLTLNGCTKMGDTSLFALAVNCPNLKQADFSNCFNISTVGVYYLIESCKCLDSLILAFCTGIADIYDVHADFGDKICNEEKKVREWIKTREKKTEKDVSHSHLKELNLRSCISISKVTALRLARMCPDLRRLNLSNCIIKFYEDDFILEIFGLCRFLSKFKVYNRMVRRVDYKDIKSPT